MPEVLCSFFSSPLCPLFNSLVSGQLSDMGLCGKHRNTEKNWSWKGRHTCQWPHSTTSFFIISETWKEVMIVHHRHKSRSCLWQGKKPRDEVYGEVCHLLSLCLLGNEEKKSVKKLLYTYLWSEHMYVCFTIPISSLYCWC